MRISGICPLNGSKVDVSKESIDKAKAATADITSAMAKGATAYAKVKKYM